MTDVNADNVVEDLANSEEECRSCQEYYRFALAKHPNDQDRLEAEEDEQENQRCQLIENIKSYVSIVASKTAVEVPSPAVSCVEGNVAGSDEDCECRYRHESYRDWSAIVQ